MKRLLLIFVIFAVMFSAAMAQEDNYRGVELYKQGKYAAALDAFRFAVADIDGEKDPEIWNYYGLALTEQKDFGAAAYAFGRAIKLVPSKTPYHSNLAHAYLLLGESKKARKEANETLKLDPHDAVALMVRGTVLFSEGRLVDAERDVLEAISLGYERSDAYLLGSKIVMARFEGATEKADLKQQLDLLERAKALVGAGIEKCKLPDDCSILKEEHDTFADFIDYCSAHKSASLGMRDPDEPTGPEVTPLKIVSKPRPGYTDRARQRNVQGTVLLAVLFGAHGKVARALVLKGPGGGLNEQAVAAARKIAFEPMKKNGVPMSVVKTVEYTFSIY